MPCDTIQRSKVDFKLEVTDLNLLKAGLEKLGYKVNLGTKTLSFHDSSFNIRGEFRKGKLEVETINREFDVNAVKRAYSTEVVKVTARKFGWTLNETSENKFEAVRRF